jgi:hypothetical protein
MPVIFSPNSQTKITPASGIRRSFSTPSNSQSAIYMLAGGLMLTSVSGLAQDSGNIVEVGEPAKGRSTYIVPITLSPTTISGWTSLTACTAYGTIMVIADVASPNPATPNVDLVLQKVIIPYEYNLASMLKMKSLLTLLRTKSFLKCSPTLKWNLPS